MTLHEAVEKYLQAAGSFGQIMPLERFGLPPKELDAMLSVWEEDYHLSRHFELIPASYRNASAAGFVIGGAEYTGIIIRDSIREALGETSGQSGPR